MPCPDKQAILALDVAAGTTVLAAAQQSGIADKFDTIDLETTSLASLATWWRRGRC